MIPASPAQITALQGRLFGERITTLLTLQCSYRIPALQAKTRRAGYLHLSGNTTVRLHLVVKAHRCITGFEWYLVPA